jgi:hypothetical protein
MVAVPMARSAFDSSMSVPPARSGGGWKAMFWFAVAAAGVGFAGYVFLVPYQKMMSELASRNAQLGAERTSAAEASAERDKLKAALTKYADADKEKATAESKRKADVDVLITQLRPALEELGAQVAVEGGTDVLGVTFPAAKIIDTNGIDVSEAGIAALKIFAGAVKKVNAKARIVATASAAPPPKELKALFHSAGELHAVRAARVMSALQDAGMSPGTVSIAGAVEKPAPKAKGKKPPPAPPDRLDIQVEPT